jgi:hypothetical protein
MQTASFGSRTSNLKTRIKRLMDCLPNWLPKENDNCSSGSATTCPLAVRCVDSRMPQGLHRRCAMILSMDQLSQCPFRVCAVPAMACDFGPAYGGKFRLFVAGQPAGIPEPDCVVLT